MRRLSGWSRPLVLLAIAIATAAPLILPHRDNHTCARSNPDVRLSSAAGLTVVRAGLDWDPQVTSDRWLGAVNQIPRRSGRAPNAPRWTNGQRGISSTGGPPHGRTADVSAIGQLREAPQPRPYTLAPPV